MSKMMKAVTRATQTSAFLRAFVAAPPHADVSFSIGHKAGDDELLLGMTVSHDDQSHSVYLDIVHATVFASIVEDSLPRTEGLLREDFEKLLGAVRHGIVYLRQLSEPSKTRH